MPFSLLLVHESSIRPPRRCPRVGVLRRRVATTWPHRRAGRPGTATAYSADADGGTRGAPGLVRVRVDGSLAAQPPTTRVARHTPRGATDGERAGPRHTVTRCRVQAVPRSCRSEGHAPARPPRTLIDASRAATAERPPPFRWRRHVVRAARRSIRTWSLVRPGCCSRHRTARLRIRRRHCRR
jgi:hypothetical protein